jgi:hypothetical protein
MAQIEQSLRVIALEPVGHRTGDEPCLRSLPQETPAAALWYRLTVPPQALRVSR